MSHPVPHHAGPPADLWSRFSADPRRHPNFRASDADRDIAAEVLNEAYGDGRLDALEHSERLEAALAAQQLGQLTPLLSDVTMAGQPALRRPVTRRVASAAVRSWVALAVLFNVIWIATWLFAGRAPSYYWPIWPMIGTAIPVIIAWANKEGGGPDRPQLGR